MAHTIMSNVTILFDPYAGPAHREIVDNIASFHNIAVTGRSEWFPVAFYLKDKRGEVLGDVLGNIWAGGIHIGTLAVTMAMRGRGFGKQLMEQAELYAVEHGCTIAFLETFSFQARPSTKNWDMAFSACSSIRWITSCTL